MIQAWNSTASLTAMTVAPIVTASCVKLQIVTVPER